MKRGLLILLLGLLACAATFFGAYRASTASHRQILAGSAPELAWLQKEFKLSDAEFSRISQLHSAYLPECHKRCQIIQAQNETLQHLLATSTTVTPEIAGLLSERAKIRAECEGAMLKHFLEVSRAMPPEQGERYLTWVKEQTFARGQGMENRHHQ